MTDKQEIIINGVDVKRCEFLFPHNKYNGCRCMNDPIANVSNVMSMTCEGNPDCNYKQLQRKTAECEELKNTLNKLTRGVVIPMQEPEVINLANHYHKALDEIEKYTIKEFCENCEADDYPASCPTCEYKEYLDIISEAKGVEDK